MNPEQCKYCGESHSRICPLIKSIEYYPNGEVKRVEFKTPSDNYIPLPPIQPPPIQPTQPYEPTYRYGIVWGHSTHAY